MRKQGLFILLLLMSFCSMMRAQISFTYGGLNCTVLSEAHCDALTSITIPDGLTSIGFAAFSSYESLSQIVVETGNTVYDSRNGCSALIETATNTLLTIFKNTYIKRLMN
ncbi:MAG: leucine-rich repeat domain-containing protein [Prevotella sp.]|nr:leucine-rich repeat domain-containing protein [Prevotella sp.]